MAVSYYDLVPVLIKAHQEKREANLRELAELKRLFEIEAQKNEELSRQLQLPGSSRK